jgi:hypothetical protein
VSSNYINLAEGVDHTSFRGCPTHPQPMHVFWNGFIMIWDLNWKWTLYLHLITRSLKNLYPLPKLHINDVKTSSIKYTVTRTRSTYKGSYNSILFMNFTYLQHPHTSFFNGKIYVLLIMHFHSTYQEMLLVPRKKMSHASVMSSRILYFIFNCKILI